MRRAAVALPVMLSLTLLGLVAVAGAAVSPEQAKRLFENERWAAEHPESCALLDESKASRLMNALERLALLCGRDEVLGRVAQEENEGARGEALGTDVRANDVGGESGSRTQHETTIARNEATGTLCTAFDDSYSGVVLNTDYTGFARSTDGGFQLERPRHGPSGLGPRVSAPPPWSGARVTASSTPPPWFKAASASGAPTTTARA